MIRRDLSLSIAAFALVLLWPSPVRAQQPAAPQRGEGPQLPAPTNLQVLPKETPPAQVFQIMQNFAGALGVQCGYCHVATPPAPAGGDAPAGRRRAATLQRCLRRQAAEENRARDDAHGPRYQPKVAAAVGKSAEAATRVGCVTCHRGVAIPKQLADILDQTAREKGTPAAVAQYKDQRKQDFGAQAYDFSEASLVTYAQRATQANKADDAITWLQLNLEYFPMSALRWFVPSPARQERHGSRN